jgi:hypothetical protein
MSTETERERMVKANLKRNLHVLVMASLARAKVQELVESGFPKADIFLMANQMKDIAERFD